MTKAWQEQGLSAAIDSQDDGSQSLGDPLPRSVVEALYAEHGDELRRLLLGILRDPQQASDVLQATFAKVLVQGHTSHEETRKAWLFRVAYHEALAWLRRRNVGDKVLKQVAWSQNNVTESSESNVLRGEIVDQVRDAIELLPAQQRQVLRMRIYEEKTFAEIAEELRIPLGTALGRMRSAMEKLRTSLNEHESEG